ncbi:nuclease activity [Pristimantis euphronides]
MIVRHTCSVMWERLLDIVMPQPKAEDWLVIAAGFSQHTQFPNCIGALDGKHIRLKKPAHSGSRSFNYKQCFSVALMAVADSKYNFVLVDTGAYGSPSDARVCSSSQMGQRLRNNELHVPGPSLLPGSTNTQVPHVLVADEGFGLSPNVLRPYPRRSLDKKRIFNYRLTRERRFVEGAFGILSAKLHVLLNSMELFPENAT